MSVELPAPLAAFFAAENGNDSGAFVRCFAEDAVVRDEGQTVQGRPAIRQWMEEAKRKYQHQVEPLSVAEREGKTVVTAKVSGNFPNSPATLDHVFTLQGTEIASLEIG